MNVVIVFRDGFIYFPDFCEVILEKYRLGKEGDEHFRQNLFKVRNYLM